MKLIFFLLLANSLYAQHCVFDGSYIVLIKLETKNGKPASMSNYNIILNEKMAAAEDSCCTFAATFESSRKVVLETKSKHWNRNALYFENSNMFKNGVYAVRMYSDNIKCLFSDCNHSQRIPLTYTRKRSNLKGQVFITSNDIYTLCYAFGNWDRIKPVIITVPDEDIFDAK